MSPDRAELGLKTEPEPADLKKNRHLPSWFQTPVFTVRTCLALLAVSCGMDIAKDEFTNILYPPVAHADSSTAELRKITRVEDCKWDLQMEARGLRPSSQITLMRLNYDVFDCSNDKPIYWNEAPSIFNVGVTDSTGQIIFDFTQSLYGGFAFLIYDDYDVNVPGSSLGHTTSIWNVSYTKSQIPINTPTAESIKVPPITKETPKPTATSTSTSTPEATATFVVPSITDPSEKDPDLSILLTGTGITALFGLTFMKYYSKLRRKISP